jgi:hypothetical protein
MLNLNTRNLPFVAVPLAPPSNANEAGVVVLVAKPETAFTAVPARPLTSLLDTAVTQVLAPFVPFR